MEKFLLSTYMLDFGNPNIQKLIEIRKWKQQDDFNKILETYLYVRDEILFGYNIDDTITASQVLNDGYGQCNTKGTLFMALLRAVGIPCRIHGFTINKTLQKGAMTGLVYLLAPQNIVHSWVEVLHANTWYNLEGFILDKVYLTHLQDKFKERSGNFCGYGVAVTDFKNPIIDWNTNDTYIQKEGINQDFGIFDSPDDFFAKHLQEISTFKRFAYQNLGRHLMNYNVNKIRSNYEAEFTFINKNRFPNLV